MHRDIALFETAMGIVKNLMLNKYKKVDDLLKADLEYNNALYEVYMYKTKARQCTQCFGKSLFCSHQF